MPRIQDQGFEQSFVVLLQGCLLWMSRDPEGSLERGDAATAAIAAAAVTAATTEA